MYVLLILHLQANLNNIIILSGIKENISTRRSCDVWWSGDVMLLQDLEEPWILPSADKILEDHVRSSVRDLKLTCIWVLQQGNGPIGVTWSKSWPESDRRRRCGVTLKRRCCSGWQPVISFRAFGIPPIIIHLFDLNDRILNMQKKKKTNQEEGKDGGVHGAAACGETNMALKQENMVAGRTSGKRWQMNSMRKKYLQNKSILLCGEPCCWFDTPTFFLFCFFPGCLGLEWQWGWKIAVTLSHCTVERRWSSNYAAQTRWKRCPV